MVVIQLCESCICSCVFFKDADFKAAGQEDLRIPIIICLIWVLWRIKNIKEKELLTCNINLICEKPVMPVWRALIKKKSLKGNFGPDFCVWDNQPIFWLHSSLNHWDTISTWYVAHYFWHSFNTKQPFSFILSPRRWGYCNQRRQWSVPASWPGLVPALMSYFGVKRVAADAKEHP